MTESLFNFIPQHWAHQIRAYINDIGIGNNVKLLTQECTTRQGASKPVESQSNHYGFCDSCLSKKHITRRSTGIGNLGICCAIRISALKKFAHAIFSGVPLAESNKMFNEIAIEFEKVWDKTSRKHDDDEVHQERSAIDLMDDDDDEHEEEESDDEKEENETEQDDNMIGESDDENARKEGNNDDEDEEYEVERIMNHRVVGDEIQYHVYWKEYTSSEATWEPASSCVNVESAVQAYWNSILS